MTDPTGRPLRSLAVADVDLDRGDVHVLPVRTRVEAPGEGVFALGWSHGRPVGELTVLGSLDDVLPELGARARERLLPERWEHHLHDALATPGGLATSRERGLEAVPHPVEPPSDAPTVSIAVCTRDRPESLRPCLEALAALSTPVLEVLVVDNASADDRTREVVEAFPGVRYVHEPRRGLDWARNRALLEAGGDVVAYTDDDTEPHADWVAGLLRAWREEPTAVGVTGLVTPRELATPAQVLFEHVGGFGRGYRRLWFSAAVADGELPARTMRRAGWPGTGANMAFRREDALALGGFDTAMDVGTPTGGGGDLEMFFRVVAAGGLLVYEPSAVVRHVHRSQMPELLRQMRGNGTGSYSCFLGSGRYYGARNAREFRRMVVGSAVQHHLRGLGGALKSRGRMPVSIRTAESRGAWEATTRSYYAQARRQAAEELARHGGPVTAPAVHARTPAPSAPAPDPVMTVELGGPGPVVPQGPDLARPGRRVRVQVLRDGVLERTITCWTHGSALSPSRLRWELVDQLGPALLDPDRPVRGADDEDTTRARRAAELSPSAPRVEQSVEPSPGVGSASHVRSVTVLLSARTGREQLPRALDAVAAQRTSREVEVVLVLPEGGTAPAAARPAGTVHLPPAASRSSALGPALEQAGGEVLVLLDAGLDVDDGWLDRLLAPFDDPSVAAVTGSVLLPDLRSLDSQVLQDFGALDAGPHRRVLDAAEAGSAVAGQLGGLAHAAVRAEWVRKLDDPRGGPGDDGGDLALLGRVLEAGGRVQHEPRARAHLRSGLGRPAVRAHLRDRTAEEVALALAAGGPGSDGLGWQGVLRRLTAVAAEVRAARLGDDPVPAYVPLAHLLGVLQGVRRSLHRRRTSSATPAA